MKKALSTLTSQLLLSLLCLNICLITSGPNTAEAQRRVSSELSGLPKTLPRDARLIVRTLSLSNGRVTKSTVLKRAASFSASPSTDPSVLAVSYLSRSSKKLLNGVSKKFVAGLSRRKLASALSIKLRKPTNTARQNKTRSETLAASDFTTVGIGFPIDGITISGPDDFPLTGRSQIQLLVTSLVNDVACYGKSGGFVIIELDPEIQKARQFEFDLCSSGRADPATCAKDLYQPPSQFIRGTLSIDKGAASLTLVASDASGKELSRFTSNGSINSITEWDALSKDMAQKLGTALCSQGSLLIDSARCETPTCNFSCGAVPAIRTLPKISGTARGPVGSGIVVSMDKNFATINCGSWSVDSCDSNVCCKRTSDSQPESTNFEAVLDLLQGLCVCPVGFPTIYETVSQLTGQNPIEVERDIECPT